MGGHRFGAGASNCHGFALGIVFVDLFPGGCIGVSLSAQRGDLVAGYLRFSCVLLRSKRPAFFEPGVLKQLSAWPWG